MPSWLNLRQSNRQLVLAQQTSKMTPSNKNTFDRALQSFQAGKLNDAERYFRKTLQYQPTHVAALNLLSIVLTRLEKYREAERFIQSAVRLNSNSDVTFYNYGIILKALKRPIEALERFNQALAINGADPETWNNRGTVLNDLNRYDDAISDFDKAISLRAEYPEAFYNRGQSLAKLQRFDEAFSAYDKALALRPDLAEASLGRGNILVELKRYDEAFSAYDIALALKPDLVEAWVGRGNGLFDTMRYDEAFSAYESAIAQKPDFAEAWLGRGNSSFELQRYEEAFASYDKALALKPDLGGVEDVRLYAKMNICDWRKINDECAQLIASVKSGKINTSPFSFLTISSSAEDQLQCARAWIAEKASPNRNPIWQGEKYAHDRIRVAYLSADFHEHATSHLMAGLFDGHDKSRFETIAISWGPDDNSEMRKRVKKSFDRFIGVEADSDKQIADLARSLEIDILVDLKGFTSSSRTNIFAWRPAPIQVNYLGYPGTMGAPYIDYIVADRIVIPEDQRQFYSEKVVVLPNCYQVNDATRPIADRAFTRTELGLPSSGFVFCCFNNNYKITPHIFDCWMRILKQVEGSVIWLLEANTGAAANLKKEAVVRGVNAERLVFGKRIPQAEHLARHQLADLFLDTVPCNAHTTASDALWSGLPLLTCLGDTFAGRVAASLLMAIDLPELITKTLQDYECLAIELGTKPEKLSSIKRKLANNRLRAPLFDTKLFSKHIEAAYTAMHERYQIGLAPDLIVVANS